MSQLSLRPFSARWIGFDELFDRMERQFDHLRQDSGFPPYNLYKEVDGDYTIELALAGYKKEDIVIEHDKRNSQLKISSAMQQAKPEEGGTVLNAPGTEELPASMSRELIRGIANRSFSRAFTLADDMVVDGAEMINGLLTVRLKKVVNEADLPLRIPVL